MWDYFAAEAGYPNWNYTSVLDIYRRIEDWNGTPNPKYRELAGLSSFSRRARSTHYFSRFARRLAGDRLKALTDHRLADVAHSPRHLFRCSLSPRLLACRELARHKNQFAKGTN
jgi:hypothetical protein